MDELFNPLVGKIEADYLNIHVIMFWLWLQEGTIRMYLTDGSPKMWTSKQDVTSAIEIKEFILSQLKGHFAHPPTPGELFSWDTATEQEVLSALLEKFQELKDPEV